MTCIVVNDEPTLRSKQLGALSHPVRFEIFERLAGCEITSGQLCEGFSISRWAVQKHLVILEEASLVCRRRQGRHVWFYRQ